jgi:hypothetical protein
MVAMASACRYEDEDRLAFLYLIAAEDDEVIGIGCEYTVNQNDITSKVKMGAANFAAHDADLLSK